MTDPKVDEWYRAISRGDCISAIDLLKADASLVKVGWERDLKRSRNGREVSQSEPGDEWEGLTALHVGTHEGSIQLVEQVLKLYNVTIIDTDANEDEQGASPMSSTTSTDKTEPRSGDFNPSHSEITEGKGPTTEDSRHDSTVLELDQPKGPECAAVKTGSTDTGFISRVKRVMSPKGRSKRSRPVGDKSQEKAQFLALQNNAGDSESSLYPPNDKSAAQDERINLDKICNESFNCKELHNLLAVRDGRTGRGALIMAMCVGHEEMVNLLLCAEDQCEPRNPSFREDSRDEKFFEAKSEDLKEADRERRKKGLRLRKVTKDFEWDSGSESLKRTLENVLTREEYTFHFMWTTMSVDRSAMTLESLVKESIWNVPRFWRKIRSCEGEVWRSLLQLQDGNGRTPFLAALEVGRSGLFEKMIFYHGEKDTGEIDEEVVICALTSPDAAGMTPLHWAATYDNKKGVALILNYAGKYDDIRKTCNLPWVQKMWTSYPLVCQSLQRQITEFDGDLNCEVPQTPLQAAVIRKNFDVAQLLMEFSPDLHLQGYQYFDRSPPGVLAFEWDVVELAFLAGTTTSFAQFLQKKDLLKQKEWKRSRASDVNGYDYQTIKHPIHPLHLVAASGDYKMLRFLINNLPCDPFIEDFEGNTALHHALKIRHLPYLTHFFDYIGEYQFQATSFTTSSFAVEAANTKKEAADDTKIAERQGCINLLLQAGCDIFKANKENEAPYPMDFLSINPKFLSFWYNVQTEEFKATQNNLNFAGNAIAITAALVATVSYVGPLQPPLGYGGDFNQIQDENIWVLMFIVFDTISFYLAITAITVALIPSKPQQAVRDELQRTRGMLVLAVGILFPSIICVFGAFACGSMAMVSADTVSSIGGRLTLSTTCIGGFLCVMGFLLFATRLLAFISPRTSWVKTVYGIIGKIRAK